MNILKSKSIVIVVLVWIALGIFMAFLNNSFDMLIFEIIFAPFTIFVLFYVFLLNNNLDIAAPILLVWAFVVTIYKLSLNKNKKDVNQNSVAFWRIILLMLTIIALVIIGWMFVFSNLT